MEQHGDSIPLDKKSGFTCPFCQKKSASCRAHRGHDWFKCFNPACPSGTQGEKQAWDEVGYLAFKLGIPSNNGNEHRYSDAAIAYLKEAGVWREDRLPPSIMPGQQKRRSQHKPPPSGTPPTPAPEIPTAPPESPAPAVNEGAPDANKVPGGQAELEIPAGDGTKEPEAAQAVVECNTLRVHKDADGALGGEKRPCGRPGKWKHPQYLNGVFCDECRKLAEEFFPNNWVAWTPEDVLVSKIANEDELTGALMAVRRLRTKIGTAKAFRKDTTKDEALLKSVLAAIEAYETSKKVAAARNNGKPKLKQELGYAALDWFYSQLTLSAAHERELWVKRALPTSAVKALGFRSSSVANRELLLTMPDLFPWEEILASGLWLPKDERRKKDRRPNSQFCGAGRIRKLGEKEKPGQDQWKDDDGFLWGWCEPILIPYLDDRGKLIGLRPHKGMGTSGTKVGTPHLYVPRDNSEAGATYPVVLVTEGEFKAAVVWTAARAAAGEDGIAEVGACAIPGISFGKHFKVREELEDWLELVECKVAKVGFDDEDKSSKDLGRRHQTTIWARFLARSLADKLHIRTQVCTLPKEWRLNGKADWDGAAAQIVHGGPSDG